MLERGSERNNLLIHISIQYINSGPLYYFQPECDSFTMQKACNYQDIPW